MRQLTAPYLQSNSLRHQRSTQPVFERRPFRPERASLAQQRECFCEEASKNPNAQKRTADLVEI